MFYILSCPVLCEASCLAFCKIRNLSYLSKPAVECRSDGLLPDCRKYFLLLLENLLKAVSYIWWDCSYYGEHS